MSNEIRPIKLEVPKRLQSLDALRGFVMFWIIGGGALAEVLAKATGTQPFIWIGGQMEHPLWDGFAWWDVIFPTFLFAAGAALPYSALRRVAEGKTTHAHELLIGARRTLILIFLGLVIGGFLHFDRWAAPQSEKPTTSGYMPPANPHPSLAFVQNVRFPSVLGRIAIAWFLAMAISLWFAHRGRIVCIVGLLLGYWAAMKLIPLPGHVAGDLTQGNNLCDYIDQLLLPGRLYRGNHDPEGLFSTIPAIATALLGVTAGDFIRCNSWSATIKACVLVAAGAVFLGIAWSWNHVLPVNKNLWSSSFVIAAGGISLILLGFFHWLIEARGWVAPAFFFIVIGMNAIAIYVATEGAIDFPHTSHFLFSGAINAAVPASAQAWRDVLNVVGAIVVEWLCLLFLWWNRIFIRV